MSLLFIYPLLLVCYLWCNCLSVCGRLLFHQEPELWVDVGDMHMCVMVHVWTPAL